MKLTTLHYILIILIGLGLGCESDVQFSTDQTTGQKLETPDIPPGNPDGDPDDPNYGEPPSEEPPIVEEPEPQPPVAEEPEPPMPQPPVEEPPVAEEPEPPVSQPPVETPPGTSVVEEEFEQEATGGQVDILFVIDNSLSMRENQKKLSRRFLSFISDLNDVDWQIAFTTVDSHSPTDEPGRHGKIDDLDGAPGRILTPDMDDPARVFAQSVERDRMPQCRRGGVGKRWQYGRGQRGPGSDGRLGCVTRVEEPIKSLVKAVHERNNANSGFFRDGADFVAVVVSDEDERSNGRSKKAVHPEELLQTVSNAWDGQKRFTGYGIIVEPGDRDCLRQNRRKDVSYYGTFVARLAELSGGMTGSICAADYSDTMKKLGESVKKTLLHQEFELLHEPLAGTLEVELVPAANIAWTLRNNVIVFEQKPPENTQIRVRYQIPTVSPYAMNN